MQEFANWLTGTSLSQTIASNLWVIPAVQSVHIVAFGVLIGSLFVVDMRILGFLSKDQTLVATTRRFAPWIWGAMAVLATTGVILVIGEPARELLSISFWIKMALLVVGLTIAAAFQIHLRNNEARWEETLVAAPATKLFAVLSFFIWIGIMTMGRLIAWDAEIWGGLSSQA